MWQNLCSMSHLDPTAGGDGRQKHFLQKSWYSWIPSGWNKTQIQKLFDYKWIFFMAELRNNNLEADYKDLFRCTNCLGVILWKIRLRNPNSFPDVSSFFAAGSLNSTVHTRSRDKKTPLPIPRMQKTRGKGSFLNDELLANWWREKITEHFKAKRNQVTCQLVYALMWLK